MIQNTMTQPAEDLTLQPALRLIDAEAPTQPISARITERRDNMIVLEFQTGGNDNGTLTPMIAVRRFNWSKLFDAGVVLLAVSSAAAAITTLMTMGQM